MVAKFVILGCVSQTLAERVKVEQILEVSGGCSADDQAILNGVGPGGPKDKTSLPAIMEWCTHPSKGGAYSLFSGFDKKTFFKCLTGKKNVKISESCSNCLAMGPQHGSKNCKSKCMNGSCKKACQTCTAPMGPKIAACAGFEPPAMSCESSLMEEEEDVAQVEEAMDNEEVGKSTGGCSAEDQDILNGAGAGGPKDKNSLPAIMEWCTHPSKGGAYSLFSGFNKKTFFKCLTGKKNLKISESCSNCLAKGPDHGSANCKSKCASGSCKKACQACTAPSAPKIAACAGFEPPAMECGGSLMEEESEEFADEEMEEVSNSTGGCSPHDQDILNGAGPGGPKDKNSLPAIMEWCTHPSKGGAYSLFSGFSQKTFFKCLSGKKNLGISESCSNCLAIGPKHGSANCKSKCASGSCKKACQHCTAPMGPKIAQCAGFEPPAMTC